MTAISPKVYKTHEKQRFGKGFSREELKKAGTDCREALRLGIRIDPKRKTAHEANVAAVKAFVESKKVPSKPKRKSKSAGPH